MSSASVQAIFVRLLLETYLRQMRLCLCRTRDLWKLTERDGIAIFLRAKVNFILGRKRAPLGARAGVTRFTRSSV